MKDKQKQTKKIIESLLDQMGFDEVVVETKTDDKYIKADIKSLPDQSGILIGHHGEGIDAFQLIVNLMLNQNTDEWQRVLLNVNDYRESREETIKNMATKAAENAKQTGKEVVLNYLPSHERRIAHIHLEKDKDIQTYSQGEGKYRRMVIAPAYRE